MQAKTTEPLDLLTPKPPIFTLFIQPVLNSLLTDGQPIRYLADFCPTCGGVRCAAVQHPAVTPPANVRAVTRAELTYPCRCLI